jgi:hypothetical protein
MTFEAHVSDDFMIDGVAIYVSIRRDAGGRQILHFGPNGSQDWDDHDPLTATTPTLKLPGEAARALLDALLRFYQGAADTQTLRSDLLHERGRVDKLTDAVISIAAGTS